MHIACSAVAHAHAKKTPVDKLGEVRHFVSLGAELLWEAGELSKLFRADDRCPSAMESTEDKDLNRALLFHARFHC